MQTRMDLATRALGILVLALGIQACVGRDNTDGDTPTADSAIAQTPLDAACTEVARRFRALPSGRVEQVADSFPGLNGPGRRYGCVVRAYGPLREPVTPEALSSSLPDSLGVNWKRDDSFIADGLNGRIYGLWRGDVLCIFRINWNTPDPADTLSVQEPQYIAEIGCELLPDHVIPQT